MRGRIALIPGPRSATMPVMAGNLCDNCVNKTTGATPSGKRCAISAAGAPLLEAGRAVQVCSGFKDAQGRRQLIDSGGPLRRP